MAWIWRFLVSNKEMLQFGLLPQQQTYSGQTCNKETLGFEVRRWS
jgi:hypothetical protein